MPVGLTLHFRCKMVNSIAQMLNRMDTNPIILCILKILSVYIFNDIQEI